MSSEDVARSLYAQLDEGTRRTVDAWRDLGNDLVTSLLNSGALGGKRRHRPADDLADWHRRMLGQDKAFVLQRTCEHEAAHAVTARALGLQPIEVFVDEDDRTGWTRFSGASRRETAIVAAASDVWITEFRATVFPGGDRDGCRDDHLLAYRNAGDDYELRGVFRSARKLLREHREDVLAAAEQLARTRQLTLR